MDPILETWTIGASMNDYLLKAIPEAYLKICLHQKEETQENSLPIFITYA